MSRFDLVWLASCGIFASVWCLTAAPHLSATFDEPFYVRAGVESWRSGSNFELMRAGTMPLPVDVQTLPIYLWERWRGEPFSFPDDLHRVLPLARGMNLLFLWGLLLYGGRLAASVGGPWAGRLAVLLLASEPNLLAHACLATTDIALTALVLASVCHFQLGRGGTWRQRWLDPGLVFGLALCAKVSAITFVPLILAGWELHRLWPILAARPFRFRELWHAHKPVQADAWRVFFVGLVVAFLYCGTDWQAQPKWVRDVDQLEVAEPWGSALRWTVHHLRVFPNAAEAFHYQFKHNIKGHGAAILGEWHQRAVPYYFPVALTIKLSLPVLTLLLGLLLRRPQALVNALGVATMVLVVFSLACRVQIGIRLVFPLVASLILTLAVALVRVVDPASRSGIGRWGWLGLLVGLLAMPPLRVWPDGIRFANDLWGGTAASPRLLAESNSDWGQGLRELDRWLEANELRSARIWYYGTDPSLAGDRNRILPLHVHYLYPVESPADVRRWVAGNVVAVSTTLLYGNPNITPTMPMVVEFFHRQTPIATVGCFVIYDFR